MKLKLKDMTYDSNIYKSLFYMLFEKENLSTMPKFESIDLEHILPKNYEKWARLANWTHVLSDETIANKYVYAFGNVMLLNNKLNRSIKNSELIIKEAEISKDIKDTSLENHDWNKIDFSTFTPQYILDRSTKLYDLIFEKDILMIDFVINFK